MSEGGEARDHEGDEVEAVVRAFLGDERWATMTTERRGQECERMHAALDAVRCAQGRDTDAPERSPESYDATNSVRLCVRCEDEYGVGAGADKGDKACSVCGSHEAPHVYPSDERLGELLDGETK